MSNATHTAGPWNVETREHVHAILCRPTRKGEHREVAFIERTATASLGAPAGDLSSGSITAQQRTREELEANARLVAAAPDLLAVCKEIACRGVMVATKELIERLMSAIANAEGRVG
jgi:hypothetical protein